MIFTRFHIYIYSLIYFFTIVFYLPLKIDSFLFLFIYFHSLDLFLNYLFSFRQIRSQHKLG